MIESLNGKEVSALLSENMHIYIVGDPYTQVENYLRERAKAVDIWRWSIYGGGRYMFVSMLKKRVNIRVQTNMWRWSE